MEINAVALGAKILPARPLPVKKLPQLPKMPSLTCPVDQLKLQATKGAIPALAPIFDSEPELPPIEVETRENFTYFRNAFGTQITQVDYGAEGKYFYALSDEGLAVMLRQHNDKRDTLNFSDMNFNIGKPSQIPNVYFHVQGEAPSKMYFNQRHEVVVELSNGEQLRLDRETGQTPIAGPISVRFLPDEAGQNFDVVYCGPDQTIKRFKSKGDTIQW